MKSLLRYNSLLCLCRLGFVLSLISHTHTHSTRVSEWQAGCMCVMCVGWVLPYEMYTRVNLTGVNGFLNVTESQGMIKERSVIHCPHDHHRASPACVCVECMCVCSCVDSRPTSTRTDVSMIYAPIRLALGKRE